MNESRTKELNLTLHIAADVNENRRCMRIGWEFPEGNPTRRSHVALAVVIISTNGILSFAEFQRSLNRVASSHAISTFPTFTPSHEVSLRCFGGERVDRLCSSWESYLNCKVEELLVIKSLLGWFDGRSWALVLRHFSGAHRSWAPPTSSSIRPEFYNWCAPEPGLVLVVR